MRISKTERETEIGSNLYWSAKFSLVDDSTIFEFISDWSPSIGYGPFKVHVHNHRNPKIFR